MSLNDTTSRDETTKFERDSTYFDAPADLSRELKQSTKKFLSTTMKKEASGPSKYQQSNAGSQSSQLSDPRRLESRAKLLKQEPRMAIEKKRDLELKREQRQLELVMEMTL